MKRKHTMKMLMTFRNKTANAGRQPHDMAPEPAARDGGRRSGRERSACVCHPAGHRRREPVVGIAPKRVRTDDVHLHDARGGPAHQGG